MSETNVTIGVVENTIDITEGQNTVVVSQVENTINVSAPGPQGAQGSGASHSTYTFTQSPASATWTIVHNLAAFPSVEIVDSAGTRVIGDITYIDNNSLTVQFVAAFGGKAYLN